MGQKVTFDWANKIIQVTIAPVGGVIDLDVKVDLYSDGKEDWKDSADLSKFRFPITAVGGNPLPGSKSLGSTFFLEYGWVIRPYEGTHQMLVNGNLYARDGSNPYIPTVGSYNVQIINQVSSLVDSTVQQLPEIEYASFNGGVTIDVTAPTSGTTYPFGTPQKPVNNIDDAYAISVARGLPRVYIIGDLPLTAAVPNLSQFTFVGQGKDRTTITIDPLANVPNCEYFDAHVTGTLDGNSRLRECLIDNLNYIKGYIEQCVLAPGTIVLAGTEEAHFLDCWSGQPGVGMPTIDMGGSGQALALRNYNGGVKIVNKSGSESVSIDMNSGQIQLGADVTGGTIVLRGVGTLTEDLSSGATVINQLVNTGSVASAVWNAIAANYLTAGTMGHYLQRSVLSVVKFLGLSK